MKSTLLLPLALIAQAANSLTLNRRDEPATVGFNLARNNIIDPIQREHFRQKRESNASADLVNVQDMNLYYFNLTVGTPGQSVSVGLDTGSSDLWVISSESTGCMGSNEDCGILGTYDLSNSSTSKQLHQSFNISYLDGSGATGEYVKDTLKFGDVTLKDFQFAVGHETDSPQGILGIGYATKEASDTMYDNFPQALVKAGYIKSAAYSLWLNDLKTHQGSILFGGVDTSKYTGDLQTLPIVPTYGQYGELAITLTGMSLQKDDSNKTYGPSDLPVYVVLDSGSTVNILPDSIADSIFEDVGAKYNSSSGYATVPCRLRGENYNLTYTFSGVDITVGISELVLSPTGDNQSTCMLGIVHAGKGMTILGDPFLRGAYVVYDLANNEISLANANFNPGKENILEIGTGDDSVPQATKVASPVTTAANSVGGLGVTSTGTNTSGVGLTVSKPHLSLAILAGAALFLVI